MYKKILTLLLSTILISCSTGNDKKIEKLIFHQYGQDCFGLCPTYHLEIKQNNEVRLHIETFPTYAPICKETGFRECNVVNDSSKIGFYKANLNTSEVSFIFNYLDSVRIDTMQNYTFDCSDDITVSYLYFTPNKSKKLLYECPSVRDYLLNGLTEFLQNLVSENKFQKTNEYFKIEDLKID
ncbi:hypothetical protein SAMN05443634_10331 [Chishuiella changwenlii]|uniref:DUF6438 domain-containing protein n=1 Tax=Chishuiella changwenlii TaxID=1434701 RepID=A0A1M6URW2_9FLAO|nr:DUF6438 domain-containing protein [Chishuiella changwenlii]GGF08168.1 hypothetical protein GCM10010984_26740 [Chishuiella changwenlii]SHK71884.1 hypothetical protein SAMN05443634_10331 [Chishuiella changwenlii]